MSKKQNSAVDCCGIPFEIPGYYMLQDEYIRWLITHSEQIQFKEDISYIEKLRRRQQNRIMYIANRLKI